MNALLNRAELPRILLRLALGAFLSIALVWFAGPYFAQAYLPVFKWAYAHVDTDNDLVGLVVSSHGVNHGEDRVYVLTIAPRQYVYVGNKLVSTNTQGRGRVSVLTAYLWQPFVVAIPLLIAWPVRRRIEWLIRVFVLITVGFAVMLLDLPTLLWSEVWSYYVSMVEPNLLSPLIVWGHLLKNGGQTLLGIVMSVLAVSIGQAWNSANMGTNHAV